ncbi:MAG: endospore germination permease [Marinisporobacter sp.]|jgi:spore germination protein KB|nr:endospore germination permease [Marinisporobacter sp.]
MNNISISDREGIILVMFFMIGETTLLSKGVEAGNKFWLVIILSMFISFFVIFMYARLQHIFQGNDLFDILEICYGKVIGKGMVVLYTWYAFHLTTLIIDNVVQFINTVSFIDTPKIIIILILLILCTWLTKEEFYVMVNWGKLFLPVISIFLFITVVLLIPSMDINNILPLLFIDEIEPIIEGTFNVSIFPFSEILIFTMIISNLETKKSPYKVYFLGLLLSGIIILVFNIAVNLVLGTDTVSSAYFAPYGAASRIKMGEFFQRMEVVVSIIMILGSFIKICMVLLGTCKGVSKVFRCPDYHFIVTPISLLLINVTYFQFNSIIEYTEWLSETYYKYAFLFIYVLPAMTLIIAELKKKQLINNSVS